MRKTATITIDADGRDKGKQFLITEMPAEKAEKWALRVFLGLAKSGVDIPDEISGMGMAGIAMVGFRSLSGMEWSFLEPLLDEMFGCIQIIPDPRRQEVVRRLIDDDIEEIGTRLRLRKEVFGLHVDFSKAAAALTSASAPAQATSAPST